MKKVLAGVLLALILLMGIGGFAVHKHMQQKALEEKYAVPHLSITLTGENTAELERYTDLKTVDFLDSTRYDLIGQYVQAHPAVAVTYRVDVGGTTLTNQDTEAALASDSFDFDLLLENLQYLPNLQSLSFPQTSLTAAQLQSLQAAYPGRTVTWTVSFQGQELPWDTRALTLENADADRIPQLLSCLPLVQDLTFTGTAPAQEEMLQLKTQYNDILMHWDFTLFGIPVSADSEEIDLTGIPMESVEELEKALPCFNGLKKVTMCDTGLASSEIDALWKRHPEIRFVWNVQIGRANVRTDITYLIPYQHGYYGTDYYGRLRDEDCTEMKYLVDMVCLDMGHMHITDISFVEYMPNLEYLIVADSRVTDLSPLAGARKLKYLEAFFNNGLTDISALAQCPALEDVNICHNWISDFSALMELEHLKHIWIAGNPISQEQKEQLEAAHPDAVIVYHLIGSTGAGWRELPNYYAQRDLMGAPYMPG